MRTTQFIGLSKQAIEWLERNVKIITVYPDSWKSFMQTDNPYDNDPAFRTSKNAFDEGYVQAIKRFATYEEYSKSSTGIPVLGMFGEEVHILQQYNLINGDVVTEYNQASPWSSGPVIFLALEDSSGNPILESLWSEEEINNA